MAYDLELAERIRAIIAPITPFDEKRMFGGLAFLVNAHIAAAIKSDGTIMIPVDPKDRDDLLARPGTMPMVMRGKELGGWICLDASLGDRALTTWIQTGVARSRLAR